VEGCSFKGSLLPSAVSDRTPRAACKETFPDLGWADLPSVYLVCSL
jgi:hypothetical protein